MLLAMHLGSIRSNILVFAVRAAASSYVISENLAKIQGREDVQALGRLREYLNSVRQRLPDHEALLVIEASGRVATSSSGRVGGVRLPPDGLNRLRTGDALVGDAYWDVALGKPAIVVAVPIRQADGRFLGAFTAKRSPRAVTALRQRLAPDDPQGVYLITDPGKPILRSRASAA